MANASPDGGVSASASPYTILDPFWIALPDGVRLAARLWLPNIARTMPVPAIVDCSPFRRRDGSYLRDHGLHAWHALNGYAGVRIDSRGAGDSEGLLEDQNSHAELIDLLAILDLIARQPWCNGRIGLLSDAWSGPTALQLAAHRPAALGAIAAIGAGFDRYVDGGIYRGGAVGTTGLAWSGALMALQARPPDPMIVGADCRRLWRTRLEAMPLFAATWLSHQTQDAYWRDRTWQPAQATIHCPVLAIAHAGSPAADAALRLLADLRGPANAILLPAEANRARSSDALDSVYRGEARRWWDHWLKDLPSDVDRDPALRVACGESDATGEAAWLSMPSWPPVERRERYHLAPGRLQQDASPPGHLTIIRSDSRDVARRSGRGASDRDLGADSIFDTASLPAPLVILGAATLQLMLAVDNPAATIHARLFEVSPTDDAAVIAEGVLNLSLRDGMDMPSPMPPGRLIPATISFSPSAWHVRAGNRLRLVVAGAAWPDLVPSPEANVLSLHLHDAVLTLPLATDHSSSAPPPHRGAPALDAACIEVRRAPRVEQTHAEDDATGDERRVTHLDGGAILLSETRTMNDIVGATTLTRHGGASNAVSVSCDWRHMASRRGLAMASRVKLQISASAYRFDIAAALDARENGRTVSQREWRVSIKRRFA